jgi:hypothetical protein
MLIVVLSILVIASQTQAQTVIYTQNWGTASGTTPPAGWAINQLGYGSWTSFGSSGNYPAASPYPGCTEMVIFDSWDASAGYQNKLYQTTAISTVGYQNITVDFTEYGQTTFSGGDGVQIQYSTNGTLWTNAGTNWSNYNAGGNMWLVHTQALPVGAANQPTLYIGLLFTSEFGYDVYFDVMHVNGLQTGTVTGTVKNCNTNANLTGVNVYVGSGSNWAGPAPTNGAGVYTLAGCPVGAQTVSAVFGGYTTYTGPVTVVANSTVTYNFCMMPLPGIITGIITNAANGNPVVGAYVTWGTYSTYSVAGGLYSLNVYVVGPNPVIASKEGFTTFTSQPVTANIPSPPPVTQNIALAELTPPPSSPFLAALNTGQTAVNLSWGLPVADYDLIYDDGIQDNFGIYATGNGANMNAVKFTPLAYPTIVKGFYLDIGTAQNYPSGFNAFSPVKIEVWTSVNGLPGVPIAGANWQNAPTAYGWTKATFGTPATIASGDFFIVMTQLGAENLTPGIAIDTTVYAMRSYSKQGNIPWLPGPGNYMIRAIVNGAGGPLFMTNQEPKVITAAPIQSMIYEYPPSTVTGTEGSPKMFPETGLSPDALIGYQVWRLLQGQEATPALWTSVGTPTGLTAVDNSWPSLPCDPYRWAVEAQYTFNRWSTATFSNVLGKCWTCNVTVNVTLSCDSVTPVNTVVTFTNTGGMIPDTIYTHVMDATGTYTFHNFWKGNYNLTVNKYDFQLYTQLNIPIFGDMTFNVNLLQIKAAPTGIAVHDRDLLTGYGPLVNWNPAQEQTILLNETFTGGFATNGWVPDAGSNWQINAGIGNPGACAEFYYYPQQQNYSEALTSKTLYGVHSPVLKLNYDITLAANGTTTLEQMAVEIWNGATWHSVGNYDNSSGQNMPWTTESVDISNYAPSSGFQVRFRAYGVNSDWITYWAIDNVQVIAATTPHDPCIIGYEVTLNGISDGFTPDTSYIIPASHVSYGTSYLVCATAIYGSGYSSPDCTTWTDKFLCPPDTVQATSLDCSALITWHKPNCGGCTLHNYTYDGGTYWNGQTWYSGVTISMGNYFPLAASASGQIKSFDVWFTQYGTWTAQTCVMYVYDAAHNLLGTSVPFVNTAATWPSGTWINVPFTATVNYTGAFYGMVDYTAPSNMKNGMGMDDVTAIPGQPNGIAYVNDAGAWSNAVTFFGYPAPETWSIRANVCAVSLNKDAPTTVIDPSTLAKGTFGAPDPSTRTNDGVAVAGPVVNPTPDAPAAAPVLLGYNIFRNGLLLVYWPYPDSLEYYDYNLAPATYHYTVDAKYNVNPYNPPSFVDTSMRAKPSAAVTIVCGYPLPFFEPWDQDSFTYQQWTFSPNQGHWSLTTALGDPLPCADFTWQPVITNYSTSLVTPVINASAWTCADMFCDFDLKLVDLHATGTEKMDIDVLVGGNWTNKGEFADSGSYDWSLKHININAVMGKAFQLRFRANGANSGNILHWYVDNIHIYGVCRPPTLLTGKENQFTTTLTWHSPKCPASCGLKNYTFDNGTAGDGLSTQTAGTFMEGNFFPISAGASGVIKSFDIYFSSNGNSSAQSCVVWVYNSNHTVVLGSSVSFINTGAAWPSGTWDNVTCPDIPYTGQFWAMVDYSGYTGLPMKNFECVDILSTFPGYPNGLGYVNNNGTWEDAKTFYGADPLDTYMIRANVCENGAKDKDAPITTIDVLNQLGNKNVKPTADRSTYLGAITDYSNVAVGAPQSLLIPEAPTGSQLMGYNVYRADSTSNVFLLKKHITSGTDTTWQDVHPSSTKAPFHWRYYVTAVFQDSLNPGQTLCEPSSDTITINFPAVGINELTNTISLYPNPANDVVNIVSSNDIKTIEVINYVGQTIYKNNSVNLKITKLDVASFNAGVYFVKITTTEGIKTSKITVTH